MSNERQLEGALKTASGVELNGITLEPVVEQCQGCDRMRTFEENSYCSSYPAPAKKWALGDCNFATHVARISASGKKINPLKASKRAARGK